MSFSIQRVVNGQFVSTYGIPRPMTLEFAVWVRTNRLIRHTARLYNERGLPMPSPAELGQAAARIVASGNP
jgi:hypothetical protein